MRGEEWTSSPYKGGNVIMARTRIESLKEIQDKLSSIEEMLDDPETTDDVATLCLVELRSCRQYLESLFPGLQENNGGLNTALELFHHVH